MSEKFGIIDKRVIFTIGIVLIGLTGFASFNDKAYAQTVPSGSNAVVNEQTQVTLSGVNSFTPVPGNILVSYYWQQFAGDPVSFTNGGVTITFTTPPVPPHQTKTLQFVLTVTDNHGAKSSTSFTLTVVHINHPPTVVTQHLLVVLEGSQVTLSGIGTDIDNDTLTYAWSQTSGDMVTLSTPNQPSATFTAPAVGSGPQKTLQFTLTANDGQGGEGSDSETVIVQSSSHAGMPKIQCGSVMGAVRGYPVTLTATVDNPANMPLTYSWVQDSGWSVNLASANTLKPTFTMPNSPDGHMLAFQLSVSSGQTLIGSCESYVYTQIGYGLPPIANAGNDKVVNQEDQVTLDGTKSTGGSLSYSWRQVSGIPVQLLYDKTAKPQFVAPDVPVESSTILTFELKVTNGFGASADQVQITVIHPNAPPTAVITMQ